MIEPLPPAARLFVSFPGLLRQHGIAVAPEQTVSFLSAIELLGPRSLEHVRKAAVATLAPHPEQRERFEALFDAHFLGAIAEPGDEDFAPDDDVSVQEDSGSREVLLGEEINETGQAATGAEALSVRMLKPLDENETLRRFGRELPAALPRRRGYRQRAARRGATVDLARSLRDAIRHDGEVMSLKKLRRVTRARPMLLLIDVSGSMKQRSDANIALAHTVVQSVPHAEVFTFGTRLTRLTKALRRKRREQALADAAGLVADWDGGTRIGDALLAFLAVPRFAAYARGAVVVVLSDGLERGDPAALVTAVARLSQRAHRIDWLTPLAADPAYKPETEALRLIAPQLASLGNGASTARICRHILSLGGSQAA
ncbi:MAG TPA: VWA domain-containing protein [Bosea sp. (in: a-proteobacteria)]|jgi:hypothetical protein|uniref:vWA domain-containing protein n=1 Tax=Bosea sp. (in: a-proteobacteria) TaxID=1871050 RepID=UPI002E0D8A4D|nr:VWA domain-containing protein [Bosea sp. (in: a-proteobacteria)]